MDIVERLRSGCTCNFESSPCGAEEECQNAFDGADEIERLRKALRLAGDSVERLAFKMPPPNAWTPQFVSLSQTITHSVFQQQDRLTS